MKDDSTGVNYHNIENHLMNFHDGHHQKFDLANNKHIANSEKASLSTYDQTSRSNLSDASLPLDLCQVIFIVAC
jgi:hypothetical protein